MLVGGERRSRAQKLEIRKCNRFFGVVSENGCQVFRCWRVSDSGSGYDPFRILLSRDSNECLHFLVPPNLPPAIYTLTRSTLAPGTLPPAPATPSPVKWDTPPSNSFAIDSPMLTVHLPSSSGLLKQMNWHRRGDYLATVCM